MGTERDMELVPQKQVLDHEVAKELASVRRRLISSSIVTGSPISPD